MGLTYSHVPVDATKFIAGDDITTVKIYSLYKNLRICLG